MSAEQTNGRYCHLHGWETVADHCSLATTPVLVRVAPQLLEKLATEDSEPVVIVGIDRQDDGTYELVLRSVISE